VTDWSKANRDIGSKPLKCFILLYYAYKKQLCFLHVDTFTSEYTLHILKVTKNSEKKQCIFLVII